MRVDWTHVPLDLPRVRTRNRAGDEGMFLLRCVQRRGSAASSISH
jgi:hypothetical protein